jgi:hypothetical protein
MRNRGSPPLRMDLGLVDWALKVNPKHQAELQGENGDQNGRYEKCSSQFFASQLALFPIRQLNERDHPTVD